MEKLTNKVALVTGGSRGIGAAIVKKLAAEGATVAFTYVNSEEKAQALVDEIIKNDGEAFAIKANSADQVAIKNAVDQTAEKFGRLDILVNSAGVSVYSVVDNADETLEALKELHAVNTTGVAAGVRAATKYLGEGGRIINIGSTFADRLAFAGFADYAASKAALAAYSRGWAWDLGKKGITVNTIHPGPTATDMNPDHSDFSDVVKAGLALGRYADPSEIAAVVAFIASPEASFVTGTTITVDGGQNA